MRARKVPGISTGASWRAAAAALGLAGCSSTSDPATGDLRLDLHHRDPRVRLEAAFAAAEAGRTDLAGDLVRNLEDRDESVRFITGIALKRMTGRDFGFLSFGDPRSRAEAVGRWRRWIEETRLSAEGGGSAPAAPAAPPGAEGSPSRPIRGAGDPGVLAAPAGVPALRESAP